MQSQGDKHNQFCPLAAVHQRLDDCHRLWHQALEAYFAPEEFRIAVQGCITTLRSVTFVLQSNKHRINEFDRWYEPHRNRMSEDRTMSWARDARNKIEKQGDLSTHSSIIVDVVASHLDILPVHRLSANLHDTLTAIFDGIPRFVLEKQILEHGVIRIERRWIANDLPEIEILDALSYVYGQLSLILDSAHEAIGLRPPTTISVLHDGSAVVYPTLSRDLSGRLPCMVANKSHRTTHIRLRDGSKIELFTTPLAPSEKSLKKAGKRYGLLGPHVNSPPTDTIENVARHYFEIATRMFNADGYHTSIAILFKSFRKIKVMNINAKDRAEKYVISREVLSEVQRVAADGVILINEAWTAIADPHDPFKYASDMPNRGEALILVAATADDKVVQIVSNIRRRVFRRPTLEAPTLENNGTYFYIEQVRAFWRQKSDPMANKP